MCSHDYPKLNYGSGEKWHKNSIQDRMSNFNFSSILFTRRVDGPDYVVPRVWSPPGILTKPLFGEAMAQDDQDFKPAKKGDSFGPSWTNHWWKVSLKIRSDWTQYERVQFEFDPGCEALIFSTEGVPLQGITGAYGGDRRVEHIIPRDAVLAGKYEIVIESSCNGMFGVGNIMGPPDMHRYFNLASADLVAPNQNAWHLMWDFRTLREIVDTLPGNSSLQNKALVTANKIMNAFGSGDEENVIRMRRIAEEVLGQGWQAKGAEVYKGPQKAQVYAISYCHIDTAWLWPYSVTQQKTARSWSTQIDLMERYSEHRFVCSQAQQFKWLEEQYPLLFDRIKVKVKSNQFHLIGGSWVENDGNMPSGEALVRQFLYGQRYFQSRFGKRCETAWLPDTFGLTGAYPQLIRDAGMKYFFTQKLSWNNINVFPHTTFNWVGIDGSQVICHMTPVGTYTAQATVGEVNKAIANHKNLESNATALLVFGNGDGGGGALPMMLDNLRRIRATTNQHGELPSVSMGGSVEDFFEDIEKDSNEGRTLPVWKGELYLEFHRGTYTSHGSIKKGNRKSEILLRDVERVATLSSILKPRGHSYVYPKRAIDECWEKMLLNQFHDVLPGSAIGMVYEDAEKLYAEVHEVCISLLEHAFSVLLPQSSPLPSTSTSRLIAFNPTSFERHDVIKVPLSGQVADFKSQVVQVSAAGDYGYALMHSRRNEIVAQPSMDLFSGYMPASMSTNGTDHFVLKNSSVELTVSQGRISSLIDVKLRRELIPKGSSGGLVIFEDHPHNFDAWEVEIHHLETSTPLSFSQVRVVADGPLRAAVQTQVKYGQSTIDVTISLDAITGTVKRDSRSYINFDAVVEWHERHKFLKFELPLDINNNYATYESQFGFVQRPTHKNTTLDAAKFEVCGLKYADLSEYGYGVAFLSESKYGFACQGNVLRISLLRAATSPDPEQDQGMHEFSWAVMPHVGSFLESDIPQAAFIYNSPLHVRTTPFPGRRPGCVIPPLPFWLEGAPNVFLETIKRGEDDDFIGQNDGRMATVVLRIYEAFGGHGRAKLHVALRFGRVRVKRAYETNILEDEVKGNLVAVRTDSDSSNSDSYPDSDLDSSDLDLDSGDKTSIVFNLEFRGFEVKTVNLVLETGAFVEDASDVSDASGT